MKAAANTKFYTAFLGVTQSLVLSLWFFWDGDKVYRAYIYILVSVFYNRLNDLSVSTTNFYELTGFGTLVS